MRIVEWHLAHSVAGGPRRLPVCWTGIKSRSGDKGVLTTTFRSHGRSQLDQLEEHLVEELAGIIWRKRRLRMAEAAVYREKLRHDATGYQTPEHLVGAALLPLTGSAEGKANIPQALAATPADTARDLRDVRRDQTRTRHARNILAVGGQEAYAHALAALERIPGLSGSIACLSGRPTA